MFSDHDETSLSILAGVQCSRCRNRKGYIANSSTCPRHDEVATRWGAYSVDRAGILATDVRRSEIYSGVCSRSDLWTSKHSLYWILSATGTQCNSRRAGVTLSRGFYTDCANNLPNVVIVDESQFKILKQNITEFCNFFQI